jgi:acyl-CoA oxidase
MNEPFHDQMLTRLLQTTLRDQGTPEQHKLFLEPAENYKAIGCYAQTEVN